MLQSMVNMSVMWCSFTLFRPQSAHLQSAEGNWKADRISLFPQAEIRVSVWLRGLPFTGRGRCDLPSYLSFSFALQSNTLTKEWRILSFSCSHTPNYPLLHVFLPQLYAQTLQFLHRFLECLCSLVDETCGSWLPLKQQEFHTQLLRTDTNL